MAPALPECLRIFQVLVFVPQCSLAAMGVLDGGPGTQQGDGC